MSSRLSLIVLTILLHVLIAIDHTSLASETQSDPALISAAFNLKKLKPTVFYSSKGLLVLKVTPGSREEAAGIQRGDVIVRLDGKAVQKVEEVTSAGDENRGYTIEYINGKELKVAQLPGKTDMGLLALDDEEVLKFLFSRIIDPFKSPSSSTTNLRGTALADITLGLKKAETSDYAEALRNYDKAMAAIGNSDDPLLNGLIYKKLGELYEKERQPAKALVYYQKSLDNFKRYDSPQFLSRLYFRMAMMNAALGRPDEALNQGKSGIEILAATGFPSDAGDAHASLGDLHNALQNEDKALESYSKAIDCYRRSNERQKEGELRVRIGSIHSGRGDMRRATQEFSRAHSIFLGTGDPSALASVYLAMADTHHKADNNSLALRNLEKALQLTAETGDSATSADIQQLKTIVKVQILLDELIANPIMEATGANQKLTSLHLDIAATSKLMEKIRRHSGADDLKKGITIANNDYFEIAIDALLQLNALIRTKPKGNSVTAMEESKRAAFRLAESMKARYFLDQLAERHVELEKGIDPDLKRQRDELEKKLSQMQAKLQHQPADKDGDGEKSHNLRQYAQKEQEFEDLKGKIRLRNPLYAAVEYPEPVDVKAVQSILRPDEALLEYCLAGDSVYRFQVSRDSFNVVQLDIDRHDLEKEIGILKRSVSTFGTNRKLLVSPTRNRAKRLYDLLLGHVAEQYKDKTIIIVPDGAIATLPFELLRTDDGFAIEKHNFAYVQSASVLEVLRTHYKANGTAGFIGFGDPVYDYGSFRDGKPESGSNGGTLTPGDDVDLVKAAYLHNGGILDRLPGSGEEVAAIAEMFAGRGEKSEKKLRLDARVDNAVSPEMASYGYIHFSAHGILENHIQAIALSQVPEIDGFLTLGEIMNSRYNARLVVLSACRTGEGKLEQGEGVIGLTRAVMYAGTSAAVVSLWNVSEQATKDLMIKFYEGLLKEGKPPAAALRQAKLKMLQEGKFGNPFYWAPFVLYGE